MLSNNLKRSVATLGVVAGLLAAAAPASAQDGGADFTRGSQDPAFRFEMAGLPVKAPTTAGTQVGGEGVKEPRSPEDRAGSFLERFDVSQWWLA
jgi:hypothetical protein